MIVTPQHDCIAEPSSLSHHVGELRSSGETGTGRAGSAVFITERARTFMMMAGWTHAWIQQICFLTSFDRCLLSLYVWVEGGSRIEGDGEWEERRGGGGEGQHMIINQHNKEEKKKDMRVVIRIEKWEEERRRVREEKWEKNERVRWEERENREATNQMREKSQTAMWNEKWEGR